MRVLMIAVSLLCLIGLTGCSTRYATVDGKDISVKVRSIWANVDYDSRVINEVKPLEPLESLDETGLTKLEDVKND